MISISTFIWAVRGTPVRLPTCLDRFSINIVCPCKSLDGQVSAEKRRCRWCDIELFLRDVFTFFCLSQWTINSIWSNTNVAVLEFFIGRGGLFFRCGAFLSDPSSIIAMPCGWVSRLVEFCSNCWYCQSCYMELSNLFNGFVKINTWISLSCYMDFS